MLLYTQILQLYTCTRVYDNYGSCRTINLLYKSTVSRQCNNSHALSIVYSILSRLFTVYTLDCLQYILLIVYSILSIVYSIHSRLFTVYTRFFYSIHSRLFTVHSIFYSIHSRLFTVYSHSKSSCCRHPSNAFHGCFQVRMVSLFPRHAHTQK